MYLPSRPPAAASIRSPFLPTGQPTGTNYIVYSTRYINEELEEGKPVAGISATRRLVSVLATPTMLRSKDTSDKQKDKASWPLSCGTPVRPLRQVGFS